MKEARQAAPVRTKKSPDVIGAFLYVLALAFICFALWTLAILAGWYLVGLLIG